MPGGQAPQALVYLSKVAPSADDRSNLVPRVNQDAHNIPFKATAGEGKGFAVVRNLGVVDAMEVFLYQLKPNTVYNVTVSSQAAPVGSFRTNDAGMANGTMIGPVRAQAASDASVVAERLMVSEAGTGGGTPVLVGA